MSEAYSQKHASTLFPAAAITGRFIQMENRSQLPLNENRRSRSGLVKCVVWYSRSTGYSE